jgi:hypothetical protein
VTANDFLLTPSKGVPVVLANKIVVAAFRFVLLLACVSSAAQSPEHIPKIQGETLAGRKVLLPDAAKGSITIFIFGFTKASKTPTGEWAKKLFAQFGTHSGFELYQLPVLEDVPRLVRGMVISGIKKGVPENARDHFVPVLQGEAELKKAVHYQENDDAAYLVLLDREGNVVQQTHRPITGASYSTWQAQIEYLLDQK